MKTETDINIGGDSPGNRLRKMGENLYRLIPVFDHIRILYEDTNETEIYAVDPPGGPFMTKGFELGNGEFITEININGGVWVKTAKANN